MNRTLLVAKREYRQLTSTRAFRISLVMLPLMFVIIGIVQSFLRPPDGSAFIILDRTGHYEMAIKHRIELNYQRQVVRQLEAYALQWHIKPPSLEVFWGKDRERELSDLEVEAFLIRGGLDVALDEIRPLVPRNAPAFAPPARRFLSVPVPSATGANASPAAFAAAIKPYFTNKIETSVGRRPLALAIYIPEDVESPGTPIRFWTNSGGGNDLITLVRDEVTHQLRLGAMQAFGMDTAAVAQVQLIEAPIEVVTPPPGTGSAGVVLRSILPMAFAYLLLITSLISGGMMLQGVVEERSNKLLETVLACISADELMRGKLLGVGAVGLTLVIVWIGCAIVAGLYVIPGNLADALRPALASLHSPLIGFELGFYFIAGYLVISMLFLAIGAMSDSMQDAQGYLMPVMMLLMIPFIVLVNSVILNPEGILPVILSWIPLYTPFAMLARLSSGVSLFDVLGTSLLLIAFIALELVLLGRIFRASLLRTGQPPRLGALVKLMLGRGVS